MNAKKITAVLFVEEIEPCLPLWVDRLGFTNAGQVPEGGKIGFVMLQKGTAELMYQSFASLRKDHPKTEAEARKGPAFLYVEVDDLDAVIAAVQGYEVTMEERTTFYGAREIGIKEPGGHSITFAQFGPKS